MKHTYTLFLLGLVCLLAQHAQAQWPNRFYIGSYYVRCDLDTVKGIGSDPHYIQAVQNETINWGSWWNADPTTSDLRYRILPEERFDQMENLGLNMAEFTIDHPHLSMPRHFC